MRPKTIPTARHSSSARADGHRFLSIDHEGYDVTRWLNEQGIAAFVLKYRLANEPGSTYKVDGR